VLFLACSVVGALFTLNGYRPVRFEPVSLPVFFAGWLTSELPLHHLAWEAVATAVFAAGGGLDAPAGVVGLAITVASWAGLVGLAVQSSRSRSVLEEALGRGLGAGYRSRMAQELVAEGDAFANWRRLVLPWLMFVLPDRDVEKVRGVDYAGDGRAAHRLDLYRARTHPTGCPVLVYVHGGGWVIGDKREQGVPLMLHMAARGWVGVSVNYRLSPRATFPDHIVDVKRALAWVRDNVGRYGGDPSFVVVCGGSAGGHLAALAALTPNDPEYQPGFEEADTAVAACVPLYGVYDFTNRQGLRGEGMGKYLLERMVMKVPMALDRSAWERASPMDRVNEDAPPFFVVHGANDTLVPVREARHFAELVRGCSRSPVVYAELPGAQHAFDIFRSIRTAHTVRAVERFLATIYGDLRALRREARPAAEQAGRR
jgi:acetyl esterase/lipase